MAPLAFIDQWPQHAALMQNWVWGDLPQSEHQTFISDENLSRNSLQPANNYLLNAGSGFNVAVPIMADAALDALPGLTNTSATIFLSALTSGEFNDSLSKLVDLPANVHFVVSLTSSGVFEFVPDSSIIDRVVPVKADGNSRAVAELVRRHIQNPDAPIDSLGDIVAAGPLLHVDSPHVGYATGWFDWFEPVVDFFSPVVDFVAPFVEPIVSVVGELLGQNDEPLPPPPQVNPVITLVSTNTNTQTQNPVILNDSNATNGANSNVISSPVNSTTENSISNNATPTVVQPAESTVSLPPSDNSSNPTSGSNQLSTDLNSAKIDLLLIDEYTGGEHLVDVLANDIAGLRITELYPDPTGTINARLEGNKIRLKLPDSTGAGTYKVRYAAADEQDVVDDATINIIVNAKFDA